MCGALQLLLVELQGDRLVEQLVKLAVQPLEQLGATDHQFQQGFAQFRGVLLGGLGGQQLLDIGGGVADFFPLLAELELVQADVGNFVREVLLQADLRQGLLLLIENSGQQQAALENADLLLQRLVALVDVVLQLFGLEVLLGQLVEAGGGAQQVVGQLQVVGAFRGQQAVGAGFFHFDGQFGDGLFRLLPTLVVDQGLQLAGFQLHAGDAFHQQIALAAADVLQQAVAGQFAAAQLQQGIQCGLFGEQ